MELSIQNCNRKLIVDDEDVEKIFKHCSRISFNKQRGNVTIYSKLFKKNIQISRFIVNCFDPSVEIDHKDRNKLNNKKDNLRISSRSQNAANRYRQSNATIEYKGVYKFRNKYIAQIKINGKQKYLGVFFCKIEAAIAYDDIALINFGEFAVLNFPLYGA